MALADDGEPEALIERLERLGVGYRAQTVPGTGVRQIFVLGPEGVKVELQFDPVDRATIFINRRNLDVSTRL